MSVRRAGRRETRFLAATNAFPRRGLLRRKSKRDCGLRKTCRYRRRGGPPFRLADAQHRGHRRATESQRIGIADCVLTIATRWFRTAFTSACPGRKSRRLIVDSGFGRRAQQPNLGQNPLQAGFWDRFLRIQRRVARSRRRTAVFVPPFATSGPDPPT